LDIQTWALLVPEYPIAKIDMNRCLYTAKVILLGLVTSQVLSSIQVYLSNADLYWKLTSIRDAGYLVVPNQQIIHRLQEFSPAFLGGLFFTLTVGTSLSLISFAAAWIWLRLLFRDRFVLILFFLLWLGCLIGVTREGFCPMVTSYFLVIPPVVFWATLKWGPAEHKQKTWLHRMIHVVSIVLLTLLWVSQVDSHMFLDMRDNLLLSNSLGRRINDFYYEYTFYPAEVFKSLDDKILKTCNLAYIEQISLGPTLEKALANHDYLNIGGHEAVDLEITQEGKELFFQHEGMTVLRVTPQDFLSSPGEVLKKFSFKTDKHAFFRQFTFLSLLVGFPITLYVILQALIYTTSSFFLTPRLSSIISTILCLLFGMAFLIPLHLSRAKETDVKELAKALESERWQERVAALKIMQKREIDVGTFEAYQKMRESPHIPERYWLARALEINRKPQTYEDLVVFLDDPSPNVVSMAFYAFSQRGDKRAIDEILKRIEASDSWYNQWYAYKALRKLGWKQNRSKQGL